MRVVIAATVFFPRLGGVEFIVDALARVFCNAGCDVQVVTSDLDQDFDDRALPYAVRRVRGVLNHWGAVRDADIIILLGPIAGVLLLARIAGRRVMVVHQIEPNSTGRLGWMKKLVKRALIKPALEVACSRALADAMYRNWMPKKKMLHVVPNPLRADFLPELVSNEARRGVLFCGRLIPEKGVDLLLHAFQLLPSGPDKNLTIVGDGPERLQLKELSRQLGLRERVKFAGGVTGPALRTAFLSHKVLVVPSLWREPFGLVALEGLALGCEVVVTERGGLPEAVGSHGVVVEATPSSVGAGMQRALGRAIRPPSEEAAEAKRRHLAEHRPDAYAKRLAELAAARWPDLVGLSHVFDQSVTSQWVSQN